MSYQITGGPDNGKTFDISFSKCNDADWQKFNFKTSDHPSKRKKAIIDAHLKADVFWCPDAFDLSFWGTRDDLDKKTLIVDLQSSVASRLDNKSIFLLLNNKKVIYDDESGYETFKIRPYTSYHWLPIQANAP